MFKVGDRVKCLNKYIGNIKIINKIGTIIHISEYFIIVQFDEHINRYVGFNSNTNKLQKVKNDIYKKLKEMMYNE